MKKLLIVLCVLSLPLTGCITLGKHDNTKLGMLCETIYFKQEVTLTTADNISKKDRNEPDVSYRCSIHRLIWIRHTF